MAYISREQTDIQIIFAQDLAKIIYTHRSEVKFAVLLLIFNKSQLSVVNYFSKGANVSCTVSFFFGGNDVSYLDYGLLKLFSIVHNFQLKIKFGVQNC